MAQTVPKHRRPSAWPTSSFLPWRVWVWGLLLLHFYGPERLTAGGSGLNTVIIANQASADSLELANYYRTQRELPSGNVLRISWPGGPTSWSNSDFTTHLLNPLLEMLAARQLTNQIDYVVLSMDIPYQTVMNGKVNSTTSALFYGLKTNGGVANSYAESEASFRQSPPDTGPGYAFLATMLTGDSLAAAKSLVDRGVASDGSRPVQAVVLAKTSDPDRNLRHLRFDNAILDVNLRGQMSIGRTNTDSEPGPAARLGFQTGLERWTLAPGTFTPGAIADSMTSFGGIIFGSNSQSNLLGFLKAGATGSYGTVAEPYSDPEKFPDPKVYFYQARGFSLAESYYQSVNAPYLGLTVAEPLAAPFAQTGTGRWGAGISNSILTGVSPLDLNFSTQSQHHPLDQVDLFLNGTYYTSLTNLPPAPGNTLTVVLNGYVITYTVSANDTRNSVATGLAAVINDPAHTNSTQIKARAFGDRIELKSIATDHQNFPYYVSDTLSGNSTGTQYRVTYLPETFPPHLRQPVRNVDGSFSLGMEIPTALPYVVQASTNLANWLPIFTNSAAGLQSFRDTEAVQFPRRFYRIAGPVPDQPPKLSISGLVGGALQLRMQSQPGQPCALLVSTNLLDWTPVTTNAAGGDVHVVDTPGSGDFSRHFRAWLVPLPPPAYSMAGESGQTNLVRVDTAVRPYRVEVRTNGSAWIGLGTNFAIGEIQTETASAKGNGDIAATFIHAGSPLFLSSSAQGFQEYRVSASTLAVGDWLQLTIGKTNGIAVVVGLTNQTANAPSANLLAGLCALVNSNSVLQQPDGVAAEDFTEYAGGSAGFSLRARTAGYPASAISVQVARSGVTIVPSSWRLLRQNLSDLQPRNHLYITTGVHGLGMHFSLDTTALPDGHHELSAVAYEGSNVRTQTRASVPVVISNTPLQATITVPQPVNGLVVTNEFEVSVAANTNTVAAILLYGTGGFLAGVTNQPAAAFVLNGQQLGVGQHPFYAMVTTTNGLRYRTKAKVVNLVRP